MNDKPHRSATPPTSETTACNPKRAEQRAGAVALFALTEVSGPSWDATRGRREQDGLDEHAAFMDALAEDGFVDAVSRRRGELDRWKRLPETDEAGRNEPGGVASSCKREA